MAIEAAEHYDVLVVGAGGAGVAAAITAAEAGARVAVLAKEPIGYGNTRIAGGGMATGDEALFADVMESAAGLAESETVRILADDAAAAFADILRYGQIFRTDPEGTFLASQPGGHSRKRTVSSPNSGASLGQTLRGAVTRLDIDLLEEVMVCELVCEGQGAKHIAGLIAYDMVDGRFLNLRAPAVILATGGAGWLFYPNTDNLRSITGDGYALALQAGAGLVDMEQVQFLPFSIAHPESVRGTFVGEPGRVGGPAGVVRLADGSVVTDGLNRRTRDEMASAIFQALAKGPLTESGALLLDLTANRDLPKDSPQALGWKRPSGAIRQVYGRDAFFGKTPFEVVPTVHHMMGGVGTDGDGMSEVAGLFAAGEARGGIHGGNRLGGVALLDIIVFGRRSGVAAAAFAKGTQDRRPTANLGAEAWEETLAHGMARATGKRAATLRREVMETVWEGLGGRRTEEGCSSALARLRAVGERAGDCRLSSEKRWNLDVLEFLELRLMLPSAEAILRAAALRSETRGSHSRDDHPEADPALDDKRTRVRLDDGAMTANWEAVP